MPTYTPEEIEQRFARLPEPLKDEMMSVENSERIFEAGKKFGLTIEQIGFLAEEAGYVVLGLTHPNNFVQRLKDHLRVDEEKAKIIAREINHQVFFPLREMLKNTHQFELTQEQIQASPPPLPPVPRVQPPAAKIPPAPPIPAPPILPVKIPTPPTVPPVSLPKSPLMQTPVSPPPSITKLPAQKTNAPIFPPLPPRMPKPIILPLIKPPLPPADSQAPPPVTHPNLSALEEKKSNQPTPSAFQGNLDPTRRPIMPPVLKPIEDIKPKGQPQQDIDKTIQPPVPPSQMMQKKFLDDTKRVTTPVQPEVERIKESLFAPPSAPAQAKPTAQPTPPPTQPPAPVPESPPKPPSSYTTHDPYREPIE